MVCTAIAWGWAWITGDFSVSYTIELAPAHAVAQHLLSKVAVGDPGNASALILNFTFRNQNDVDQLVDLTPNYSDDSTYTTIIEHDQMSSVTFQFFGASQFARATSNIFLFA
jgi:hypothetical protein